MATWEQKYATCCSHEYPACSPVCLKSTAFLCEDCCSAVDFARIKQKLLTYGHLLLYASCSGFMKVAPEIVMASYRMSLRCFQSARTWLASEDPLGVLVLRLVYVLIFATSSVLEDRVLPEIAMANYIIAHGRKDNSTQMSGNMHADAFVATFRRVSLALGAFSAHAIYKSRWPVFMLLWALSRRSLRWPVFDGNLEPESVVRERTLLRSDLGPDGWFFRSLWAYASIRSVQAEQAFAVSRYAPSIHSAAPQVSSKFDEIAKIAMAEISRHSVTDPDPSMFSIPYESVELVVRQAPSLVHLLFHTFPVLLLLDRLSLPRVVQIDHGTHLFLPVARAVEEDYSVMKAARVNGYASPMCRGDLEWLLARKAVSRVVDVGAQFGACTAIAAKLYPTVSVVALELYPANVELLRRTADANALTNLRARAVALVEDITRCPTRYGGPDWRNENCSTLDAMYPFDPDTPRACVEEGARLRPRRAGILMYLGQLNEFAEPILRGGRGIFERRYVDVVAVASSVDLLPDVQKLVGPGYVYEEFGSGALGSQAGGRSSTSVLAVATRIPNE